MHKPFKLLKLCYLFYAIFFVKVFVSFELLKAIPFSLFFTFRISAMRLFMFMNFLISLLANQESRKWPFVVLKVEILNYFEDIGLNRPYSVPAEYRSAKCSGDDFIPKILRNRTLFKIFTGKTAYSYYT